MKTWQLIKSAWKKSRLFRMSAIFWGSFLLLGGFILVAGVAMKEVVWIAVGFVSMLIAIIIMIGIIGVEKEHAH